MKKRIPVILMLVPLVLVILAAGLLNSASADTLIYCTWGEDATARWFYDHATKCSKYAFLYASPTGSWDDAVEVKQLPASYDYCFGEYDLNDEVSAYAVEHGQARLIAALACQFQPAQHIFLSLPRLVGPQIDGAEGVERRTDAVDVAAGLVQLVAL